MNSATASRSSAAPSQLMGRTDSADKTQQHQNPSGHAGHDQPGRLELDVDSQGAEHEQDQGDVGIADGL